MKRKALVAALLASSLLASACGKSDDSSDSSSDSGSSDGAVKAAWIYVGPTNDGGWTTAHDEGRKAVEKALGDKVETTYKENVPEGPEVAQVIDDLVKDGNKIIFATSFGFGDAMKAAAEKYPDVHFEWAAGDAATDNMGIYFGAGEESLYLSGMAAGAATESGTIGFVGAGMDVMLVGPLPTPASAPPASPAPVSLPRRGHPPAWPSLQDLYKPGGALGCARSRPAAWATTTPPPLICARCSMPGATCAAMRVCTRWTRALRRRWRMIGAPNISAPSSLRGRLRGWQRRWHISPLLARGIAMPSSPRMMRRRRSFSAASIARLFSTMHRRFLPMAVNLAWARKSGSPPGGSMRVGRSRWRG